MSLLHKMSFSLLILNTTSLPTIILATAEITDEGFIDGGNAQTLFTTGPSVASNCSLA